MSHTGTVVESPGRRKRAVTLNAPLIVTVHVPAPEQAPLQPVNSEPAAGVAVSVTEVPPG